MVFVVATMLAVLWLAPLDPLEEQAGRGSKYSHYWSALSLTFLITGIVKLVTSDGRVLILGFTVAIMLIYFLVISAIDKWLGISHFKDVSSGEYIVGAYKPISQDEARIWLLRIIVTNLVERDSDKRARRLHEARQKIESNRQLPWDLLLDWTAPRNHQTFEQLEPSYKKLLDYANAHDPDPMEVARREVLWNRFLVQEEKTSLSWFASYLDYPLPIEPPTPQPTRLQTPKQPRIKPEKRFSPNNLIASKQFKPRNLERLVRYRVSVAQQSDKFPVNANIYQHRSTKFWTEMALYIANHLPSREDADLYAATSEILTAILTELPGLREEFVERAKHNVTLAELISDSPSL